MPLRQEISSRPTGSVWTVGRNHKGQLGLGAADDDAHPTAAQLAALGSGVVQVAAGDGISAALTAGGGGSLWGPNCLGQMANGLSSATPACGARGARHRPGGKIPPRGLATTPR